MTALAKDRESNCQNQSLILLDRQIDELQREKRHLESKFREGKLNLWELSRLQTAMDELAILVAETIDFAGRVSRETERQDRSSARSKFLGI